MNNDKPLIDDVLAKALPQLRALVPGAVQQARMRARILARASQVSVAAETDFFTVRAAEGKWHDIAPGVRLKLLFRDALSQTFLLDVAANTAVPSHHHPSEEECYVVQGEAWVGDVRLRAGDYHFARAGSLHTGLRSESGAMLLIRTGADGPRI